MPIALLRRALEPDSRAKLAPPTHPSLLLGRTSFGIAEADWIRVTALGPEAYLEEQLHPETLDDRALELALQQRLPTLAMDVPQLLTYAGPGPNQFLPLSELVAATLARQLLSRRQLYEVMVEFWSNHFSVYHLDGPVRFFKTFEDCAVIRPHALGRFRDLLKASARSPAMLWYLDNYANRVGVAQENYARELLELHTLGVDGGYGEADVREVARAFTGWTINARGSNGFQFVSLLHDFGEKRVLGTVLPPGQGIEDGEAVLDLLASHPSTARFICTKLARRFVSDDPPPSLVDDLAAEFLATDGDIRAVLRKLFGSPAFADSADGKFKRPTELVLSTLRASGARLGGDYFRAIAAQLTALGQVPFQWEPPDGYPDRESHWLSTTALLNRWNLGFSLAEGRMQPLFQIDETALAGTAWTPAELVDRLTQRLLRRALDPADRELLIAFAAGAAPTDATLSKQEREYATVAVAGVLLASDYFQYR